MQRLDYILARTGAGGAAKPSLTNVRKLIRSGVVRVCAVSRRHRGSARCALVRSPGLEITTRRNVFIRIARPGGEQRVTNDGKTWRAGHIGWR